VLVNSLLTYLGRALQTILQPVPGERSQVEGCTLVILAIEVSRVLASTVGDLLSPFGLDSRCQLATFIAMIS